MRPGRFFVVKNNLLGSRRANFQIKLFQFNLKTLKLSVGKPKSRPGTCKHESILKQASALLPPFRVAYSSASMRNSRQKKSHNFQRLPQFSILCNAFLKFSENRDKEFKPSILIFLILGTTPPAHWLSKYYKWS